MIEIFGTKQQWSATYALIASLTSGKILMGDTELREGLNAFPINYIKRQDLSGMIKYVPGADAITVISETVSTQIDVSACNEAATMILARLKASEEEEFEIPEAVDLLSKLLITDLETEVVDLIICYEDTVAGLTKSANFSVKTVFTENYLLKPNRAGNFKYDIMQVKLSNPESNKINGFEGKAAPMLRLIEISRLGGKLKYTGGEGKFFQDNMSLIDLNLSKLLAEVVKQFYTSDLANVSDLIAEITEINPFKLKDELIKKNNFYEYKIKQFLSALASGMKPTKIWTGYGNSNGHLYLKKDGTILAYDSAAKKAFEDYLFYNTKLRMFNHEKYKFGFIEKENGQWLFKMNLSICFK